MYSDLPLGGLNSWLYVVIFVGILAWWKYEKSKRIPKVTERRVFITGCDTGFGRLLATSLDKMGVYVYAGCLRHESVEELQKQCSKKLKAVQVDVTKTDDVIKAVDFVQNDLAANSQTALWAIVNNAGVLYPSYAFEWHNKQDYQQVFDINLFGVVDVTLKFLPLIKRGREGRIVNMGSISGRVAPVCSPYTASKFAIEGFSDGLTFELRPFNISTHVIEPSFYKTNFADVKAQNNGIKRRWNEISEELRQCYGESYLKTKCEAVIKVMDDLTNPNIHEVTDAITRALFDAHPRGRYMVGNDAKFFFLPLSFLPTTIQEWVIRKVRKMTKMPQAHPEQSVIAAE